MERAYSEKIFSFLQKFFHGMRRLCTAEFDILQGIFMLKAAKAGKISENNENIDKIWIVLVFKDIETMNKRVGSDFFSRRVKTHKTFSKEIKKLSPVKFKEKEGWPRSVFDFCFPPDCQSRVCCLPGYMTLSVSTRIIMQIIGKAHPWLLHCLDTTVQTLGSLVRIWFFSNLQ